jgi:hypothetical protein
MIMSMINIDESQSHSFEMADYPNMLQGGELQEE